MLLHGAQMQRGLDRSAKKRLGFGSPKLPASASIFYEKLVTRYAHSVLEMHKAACSGPQQIQHTALGSSARREMPGRKVSETLLLLQPVPVQRQACRNDRQRTQPVNTAQHVEARPLPSPQMQHPPAIKRLPMYEALRASQEASRS